MLKKYVGLAIVLALLAGCGNKGPLYLPDSEKAKQEQAKEQEQKQQEQATKEQAK